jgi:hypothetical protein
MLRFMSCRECGAIRGSYSTICGTCQKRKRRSEQQRNRRTGAPDPRITVPPGAIQRIRETQLKITRMQVYFTRYSQNPENTISESTLKRILSELEISRDSLNQFLTTCEDLSDQESPRPIRRYRRRARAINLKVNGSS